MPEATDQHIASMREQLALPRQNGELRFESPWEARAFGIAVALHEAGVYPWRDFSQVLAVETAAAEQGDSASSYYERWLATLEKLALAQGLVTPEELAQRIRAYALGAHDEHVGHDHEHGPSTASQAMDGTESHHTPTRSTPMQVVRIYTGTDNQTHFQDVDLDTFTQLSAQVGPGPVRLNQGQARSSMDFHNAPRRQYVVVLSGQMEIEIGDGSTRVLSPGDVLVAEDLTGKGHITRGVGDQPRVSLAVPLA